AVRPPAPPRGGAARGAPPPPPATNGPPPPPPAPPPADPGTTANLLYDALRATSATSFGAGTCLASDITGTTATDGGAGPPPGGVYDYLVRSQNACGGNLGTTSAGVPRTGRSCP